MMINRNMPNVGFTGQPSNVAASRFMPSFENGGGPNRILTKTESAKNENEFRDAIREMAWRDAAAGKFFHDTPEHNKLFDNFVSVASPDRRSIIASAIQKNFMLFSRVNVMNLASNMARGQSNVHFNFVLERSGSLISSISFTDHGWQFSFTSAEQQRSREFFDIYNEAQKEWHAHKVNLGAGATSDDIMNSIRGSQEKERIADEIAGPGASAEQRSAALTAVWNTWNQHWRDSGHVANYRELSESVRMSFNVQSQAAKAHVVSRYEQNIPTWQN